MPRIKRKFFRKIICLGLSVALICENIVPAFGQEFFSKKRKSYTDYPEMAIDNTYIDRTAAELQTDINNYVIKEKKRRLTDDAYARAEEIKKEIMGDEQGDLQKQYFAPETLTKPKTDEEIKADLLKGLQSSAEESKRELKQMYEQYLQEGYDPVGLKAEYDKFLAKMNAELKEKEDNLNNNFKEVLEELKEGAEEAFFLHVRDLFDELMNLYAQKPEEVKEQLLELTPVIVTLVNKNKEHLYTEEQKQTLLEFYRTTLLKEGEKVGKDNSIFTNSCELRGFCPEVLNAITGLSVLSPIDKSNYDGKIVFDTIVKYENTAAKFSILLNGISGLLVMKNYASVRELLKDHTRKEHKITWEYVWDHLNFMSVPLLIANAHGKYRGMVSEMGDYWDDNKEYRNAYFDIAGMLAEEGSPIALGILRDYGVNKCLVKQTSGVEKETLAKYSISCGGIKPFLVGALLSGKSGADKYSLPKPQMYQAKQYMTSDGKIHNTSTNEEVIQINAMEKAYFALAKESFNGDEEAMIALHIMSEAMSDLNVVEEQALDTMLNKAFKGRIPERFLKGKNIIIDEARYSKKENRKIALGVLTTVGIAADIYALFTGVAGILKLGKTAFSFGKGLFNALKVARIGLTIKNIPALAREAAKYTKTVFMKRKIVAKISQFGKNFKEISKNYKKSVRLNVLKNAAQYTNAVHDYAAASLNTLRVSESTNLTKGLTKILKGLKFDEELGIFVLNRSSQIPRQLLEVVDDIIGTAMSNAKTKFRVTKIFKKGVSFQKMFLEEVKRLVAASPLRLEDKEFLLAFFEGADFGTELAKAESAIISLGRTGKNFAEAPLVLPVFNEVNGKKAQQIGVKFVIGEKIPAFKKHIPHYASIVEEDGRYLLKFFKAGDELIDLSAFKLKLDTKSLRELAHAVGETGTMDIKFIPKEANTFWNKHFKNVFVKNKEDLFGGRGTVSILTKNDKNEIVLIENGLKLRTYKQYDGLKLVINEVKGGVVEVFKGLDTLPLSTEGAFSLPKYELGSLLKFAGRIKIKEPWKISLIGGKNKINSLYWQALISLGVASSGLVGPLLKNYPDISTTELNLISMGFPYAFSFLAPFVAPLVKRFGAVNILKTSMGLSVAALAMPMFVGFHGFGGIQEDSPFNKPSPKLLYPSAIMVGLASALMRGSTPPLVLAVGGGSAAMKMKAFKSISSFMLVLPPLIGTGIDKAFPRYFKNVDGTLYLDENGKPVKRHLFDFSFSYPFMLGIAALALYKVQKAHFDVNIGRSATGGFTNFAEYLKDGWRSYGTLVRREMLPLAGGSLLLNGAESIYLYGYSNSVANEYIGNRVKTDALVPVFSLIVLNLAAFITRMNSKSILKAFGGDNMLGYRNTITTGLLFTGVGSYFLAKQDDPVTFGTGLILTSIGFSQITASILRYGHHKLDLELNVPKHMITSWDVSYPTVYLGMALVPKIYGELVDKNIEGLEVPAEYKRSLKNTSMKEKIWVPASALILGGGLVYLGMRPKQAAGIVGGNGYLSPWILFAETHNPAFTNWASPRPTFNSHMLESQMHNRQMFNGQMIKPEIPVSSFKPHLEYNSGLQVPASQVTPNFSIEPFNNKRK